MKLRETHNIETGTIVINQPRLGDLGAQNGQHPSRAVTFVTVNVSFKMG